MSNEENGSVDPAVADLLRNLSGNRKRTPRKPPARVEPPEPSAVENAPEPVVEVVKEPVAENEKSVAKARTKAKTGGRGSKKATKPKNRSTSKTKKDTTKTSSKIVSYRLGIEVKERVDEVSQKHNVHKSDLVRFLLTRGMDQLEAGEIELVDDIEARPRKLKIR